MSSPARLAWRIDRRFAEAVAEARVLCGGRQRRNDPYREDCDFLYRKSIRPQRR